MSPECMTESSTPTVGINTTGPTIPWWKVLLTGKNNSTLDMGRVSWAVSFMAILAHEGLAIHHGSTSSIRDFAIALGAVAAAHGAALGFKAKTEPDND
jgi:hypothetical protein